MPDVTARKSLAMAASSPADPRLIPAACFYLLTGSRRVKRSNNQPQGRIRAQSQKLYRVFSFWSLVGSDIAVENCFFK
jgi:hypothetical protein